MSSLPVEWPGVQSKGLAGFHFQGMTITVPSTTGVNMFVEYENVSAGFSTVFFFSRSKSYYTCIFV